MQVKKETIAKADIALKALSGISDNIRPVYVYPPQIQKIPGGTDTALIFSLAGEKKMETTARVIFEQGKTPPSDPHEQLKLLQAIYDENQASSCRRNKAVFVLPQENGTGLRFITIQTLRSEGPSTFRELQTDSEGKFRRSFREER